MLVRSKILSISIIKLNRKPHKSGIRLIINIIVIRVLISIVDFTLISVIRRRFIIIYANASKTSRRVAVLIKGILKRI
jgi:hypothetical protein